MPKRTYNPSKIRRIRKYGFRTKSQSKVKMKVVKRRRLKGRKKISL